MANRICGEISATLDGQSYTLRMDFNALCAFEEETGQTAMGALRAFEDGDISFGAMRSLTRVCLTRHHPDTSPDLAGDLLSEDPDLLSRLVAAAFPEAADIEGDDQEPGKTKAG